MQLDLTEEESEVLLRELNAIIENDRFPLSPRVRMLRQTAAKVPGAPPEPPPPARPHTSEECDRERAPRQGKQRRG